MNARLSNVALAVCDLVCLLVAAAIAFYAIRDWPTRYLNHTLSWSVTAFFAVSILLSVFGPFAALFFLKVGNRAKATMAALAPVLWFGFGALLGVTKLLATGDF